MAEGVPEGRYMGDASAFGSLEPGGLDVDTQLQAILTGVEDAPHRVVVVDVPADVSRIALYRAIAKQAGRWGRRAGDRSAVIDLSNHTAMPAQTIIDGVAQSWDDLAIGLADALSQSTLLLVIGLEQMLQDTPHRLAAFLEARARHQAVVVLTHQASRVCRLRMRHTDVQLDQRLSKELARCVSLVIRAAKATPTCSGVNTYRKGGRP